MIWARTRELIVREAFATVVRPRPLSTTAVGELIGAHLGPPAEERFVSACRDVAGGNPLFVLQLLDSARAAGLRPVAADSAALALLAPDRISQLVLDRLRGLPGSAVTLTESVSVLGPNAEARHAAALSGLDLITAFEAADRLAAAGVLRSGYPFDFVYPVVRTSVYESLPAGRRATYHRRAAELLRDDEAPTATIAHHLLEAVPGHEQWVVDVLRAAAASEILSETRARYLRRAIAEPPEPAERAEILLELGRVESSLFDPQAIGHLREALRMSTTPRARATAAEQLSWSLVEHYRGDEAKPTLIAAIDQLARGSPPPGSPDHEALLRLHAALLEAQQVASQLRPEELADAVAMAGLGQSDGERALLSIAAMVAPAAGAKRSEVTDWPTVP